MPTPEPKRRLTDFNHLVFRNPQEPRWIRRKLRCHTLGFRRVQTDDTETDFGELFDCELLKLTTTCVNLSLSSSDRAMGIALKRWR